MKRPQHARRCMQAMLLAACTIAGGGPAAAADSEPMVVPVELFDRPRSGRLVIALPAVQQIGQKRFMEVRTWGPAETRKIIDTEAKAFAEMIAASD